MKSPRRHQDTKRHKVCVHLCAFVPWWQRLDPFAYRSSIRGFGNHLEESPMKFAKSRSLALALLLILSTIPSLTSRAAPPDGIEERINKLLAQMTLEEKL